MNDLSSVNNTFVSAGTLWFSEVQYKCDLCPLSIIAFTKVDHCDYIRSVFITSNIGVS